MKAKMSEKLICAVFCAFLALMLLLFLLLPEKDFSEREKRYLASAPEPAWGDIASGDFGEDAETWAADHLPGRDFFVGLEASYERLIGLQSSKDIYAGKSGRLYERPSRENAAAVEKNMSAINAFAQSADVPVDLMLVPSAGYILRDDMPALSDPYIDDGLIAGIYALASDKVGNAGVIDRFEGSADRYSLYYSTDHHWTSAGAYEAYCGYMRYLGRTPLARGEYEVSSFGGFYGSAYSRSCLWQTPGESIELWDSGAQMRVFDSDSALEHEGRFYMERLCEADKYTVFLDGNHSLVRIDNPDAAGEGRLLVVRDSFSNSLGCFLADSYETVVLVDLRYYKQPVSALCESGDFDRVLIEYGLANFLSDANIAWLA